MVKILITVLVSWNRSRKKNYRLISYRIFRNLLNHSKRILLLLYKEQSAVVSLGSTPIWTNPNWTTPCWVNNKLTNKFEKEINIRLPPWNYGPPPLVWPIRSCVSYHKTRGEPSFNSISFCFRSLNEWLGDESLSHWEPPMSLDFAPPAKEILNM